MAELDKRSAKRISYRSEVECSVNGDSLLNPEISDLSVTGAFIDSLNEIPPGSRVRLKFALPTGKVVTVEAEVVHSMPHFGMGVRFLDLPEEQRRAIESLVAGS